MSPKHNAGVNKHFCTCSLFLPKSCQHVLIHLQKVNGKKKERKKNTSNGKIIIPLSLVKKDNGRKKRSIIEIKIFWEMGASKEATLSPSALGLKGGLEVSIHTALSSFHEYTLLPTTSGPFHTCSLSLECSIHQHSPNPGTSFRSVYLEKCSLSF